MYKKEILNWRTLTNKSAMMYTHIMYSKTLNLVSGNDGRFFGKTGNPTRSHNLRIKGG